MAVQQLHREAAVGVGVLRATSRSALLFVGGSSARARQGRSGSRSAGGPGRRSSGRAGTPTTLPLPLARVVVGEQQPLALGETGVGWRVLGQSASLAPRREWRRTVAARAVVQLLARLSSRHHADGAAVLAVLAVEVRQLVLASAMAAKPLKPDCGPAGRASAASRAAPMAPVTSLCTGTMKVLPGNSALKAATTASL